MDPPAESPFSRAERMFWTVWGYISEAVESVLRPTNTGDNETNSDQACSTDRQTYDDSATQSTAGEGGQHEKQSTLTASSEVKSPQTVVALEQCNTPIGQGLGTANVQCSVQRNRGSNSQPGDGKCVTLDEIDLVLGEVDLSDNKDIVLHVTERQLESEVDAKKTSHGELCGKERNQAKKADKHEKVEQSTSEQCLVKNIKDNEMEVVNADDPIRLGVHGEREVKSKEILFIKGEQGDLKEAHIVGQSEGDLCAWKKCTVQNEPINKTCKKQYGIEEKDRYGKTNDPDLKLKVKDSLWMQPNDDQHESEVPWRFNEESVEEKITHSASYLEETSDENGELERNTFVSVAAIDGGSPLTYNKESVALTEEFTVVVEEQTNDENIDKNENDNIFVRETIIEVHEAETTLWQLDEETELEASISEESDFKNDIHIRREPETYFDQISGITKENQIQEVKVSAKETQTADNIGAIYSMTMPDVKNYPRLEGTGNFEDCSSGTCGRLSGLESVVCEQTLEQLPEYNNGKWQNEDTSQRILEIGDYDELVTTQLREEVERVEADYINSNSEAEHLSLKDLMEEQPDSEQKAIGVSDLHNVMKNNSEMVKEGHTEFLGETEKPFTITQEPGCSLVAELELVIGSMQTEVIQSKQELVNAAKNKTQKADFGSSEQTEESTKTLRLDGESDEVCGPEIKLAAMFENESVKTDKNKSAQRMGNGKEFSKYKKESLETNYQKMAEACSYNESLEAELQNMDTDLDIIGTGPESLQVMMEKDVKTHEKEEVEKEYMLSEETLIELSGERIETEYTLKPDVQGETVKTEEAMSNKLSKTGIEQKTIKSQLSNKSVDQERDLTALVLVETVSEKRETEVKIIEKPAAVEPVIETNAKQTDAEILDMWTEAVFSKDTDHTFKGESKEIDDASNLLGEPICELRSYTETEDKNSFPETNLTTVTKIEQLKDIEAGLLPESETGLWINPQTDIGDILAVETEAGLSETSSDKLAKVEGALLQIKFELCEDTYETEEGTLEIAETNRTAVLRSKSPELFETKVGLTEDKVIGGPLVIDKAVPRILDNFKTKDPVASIDTNSGLLEDRGNDLKETKRQITEVGFSEAVRPDTELQTTKAVLDENFESTWHQPLKEKDLVEAVGIKAELLTDLQRYFRKDSIEIDCEPAAETVPPSTRDETQQICSGLYNEKEAMLVKESSESDVLLLERVVTTKSSLLVDSDFEKPQEGRSEDTEEIDAISPRNEVAKAHAYSLPKTIPGDTEPHLQFKAYPLDFTAQKFRISIKSPLIRPPKEPRRLLQMPSVEPSLPNPSDRKPVKGLASIPLGGMGIGIKLSGLHAGFPILKKVQAEVKTERNSDIFSQSSETKEEEHDDSTKQEAAEQKPKWMPPKNPGFGNPLMSELKNKLKKTAKEL